MQQVRRASREGCSTAGPCTSSKAVAAAARSQAATHLCLQRVLLPERLRLLLSQL